MVKSAGMDRLSVWMEAAQTAPKIQHVITTQLNQLLNDMPRSPIATTLTGLQTALQLQDQVGWANFFEGRMVTDWERVQEDYYKWC